MCMFGIVHPYLFAIPYLGIMAQLLKDINILLQFEGRTTDTIRGSEETEPCQKIKSYLVTQ